MAANLQQIKPNGLSKTRKLTGAALFSALAIVLNLTIKIPAPYASFLTYEVWEIPIVVALLVFGVGTSVVVAIVNFLALQVISPGELATGPLYNLMAVLLMLVGISVAHRILIRAKGSPIVTVGGATALGILLRVAGMSFAMATLMPLSPPLGFNVPPQVLPGLLTLIALFNFTVSLYTIPVSYWVVATISPRVRTLALVQKWVLTTKV